MAKKRKAPKSFEQPETKRATKFNVEEKFDDSEDEFYAGREKILLEESADSKRRRRLIEQEQNLQPSDEEILGYQDEDDLDSEDADDLSQNDDESDDLEEQSNNRSQVSMKSKDYVEDDEDISEDEHWGTNRADYYDADIIETEADAIEEEKEAKRLHQKQLNSMTEADFGFDENEWAGDLQKRDTKRSKAIIEKLPEAQVPVNATKQQRLQILQSRYPELQPLAADFFRLQSTKEQLDKQVLQTQHGIADGMKLSEGIPVNVKRDALVAYLAAISTYFVVLSSKASKVETQTITALPPLELHEHAVIQTLARARGLWDRVANENTAILKPAIRQALEPSVTENRPQTNGHKLPPPNGNSSVNKVNSKSSGAKETSPTDTNARKSSKSQKMEAYTDPLWKDKEKQQQQKKKKPKKADPKSKPLDLTTLMATAATEAVSDSDDSYGDETPLTAEQFAEKDRKRKSLRFYTSQISTKANRRGHASREAGGDDDLPYKERQRDRQERLIKAAEAKGRAGADDFDNDDGDGYEDLPSGLHDQNDEYYDTLLNASTTKKAEKKAKAEAYAAAAAQKGGAEVYEEETVGPDGKRAITYAIAKNKGLAPKRKKDVRNPRVKKRKKFDEKVKKLGSMRQVYKGGEGRGGYGGELTGIKTNIVKSVKL